MAKKYSIGLLIVFSLLFGVLAVCALGNTVLPTTSTILIDGEESAVRAYNINDRNYFQLRDLGAEVGFGVDWDSENDTVLIFTDGVTEKPETTKDDEIELTAVKTASKILVDGEEADIEAYNVNGRNYFQLRDLGEAVGFEVDWDEENNTVLINTKEEELPTNGPTEKPSTPVPTKKPSPEPTRSPEPTSAPTTAPASHGSVGVVELNGLTITVNGWIKWQMTDSLDYEMHDFIYVVYTVENNSQATYRGSDIVKGLVCENNKTFEPLNMKELYDRIGAHLFEEMGFHDLIPSGKTTKSLALFIVNKYEKITHIRLAGGDSEHVNVRIDGLEKSLEDSAVLFN